MLVHTPIEGIGSFYGGVLHPVAVISHLLVVLALSICLGQQGLASMRRSIPLTWASFALVSLLRWKLEWEAEMPIAVVLGVALCLGLAAIVARRLPSVVVLVVGAASAACLGYDTDTLQTPWGEEWMFLVGAALGFAMSLICIAGATEAATRPASRIASRVLASWVTTASLLVLALEWTESAT